MNPSNSNGVLTNGANVIEYNSNKGLALAHYRGAPRPYVICKIDSDGFCSGETYFQDLFKAAQYYAIQVFIAENKCVEAV